MLVLDGANWYGITQENGNLFFQALVDGVMSETFIPYVNATHRWWRIRHESTPNQIVYETSTDGSSWTERRRIASTVAVTTLSLEVSAGTYSSVTTPGFAIFDNVTLSLTTPLTCTTPITGSPVARSEHLCMSVNFATYVTQAPETDNWPMTWADDGHQYTSFGDGQGFGGDGGSTNRVSLGFARVEGTAASYTGYNVWGGVAAENPATFQGKSYGIISIGSMMYAWISPLSDDNNYNEARLASSSTHGATWTQGSWAFTRAHGIVLPTILQFGQANAEARDEYMYSYFINLKPCCENNLMVQKPGEIVLARVPASSPTTQAHYQFFSGLDGSGNPTWTNNVALRQPVFVDANGVGWNLSVIRHPYSGRYILITEHDTTMNSNIGIFDAPEPWGPWTTVWYQTNWGAGTVPTDAFFWNFAPKWFDAAGAFTLVFTGTGTIDSWNTVQGTLTTLIEDDPVAPAAPTNLRVVGQ